MQYNTKECSNKKILINVISYKKPLKGFFLFTTRPISL